MFMKDEAVGKTLKCARCLATARWLSVIAVYVFVAVFAPILAPYGEAEVFPIHMNRGAQLLFLELTKLAAMSFHA